MNPRILVRSLPWLTAAWFFVLGAQAPNRDTPRGRQDPRGTERPEPPRQVTVPLVPAGDRSDATAEDDGGVNGAVQFTELLEGGLSVTIAAQGLTPDVDYAAFTHMTSDGSAPASPLTRFVGDAEGNAVATAKTERDLDDIGSVSVRVGTDYGAIVAVAKVPLQERTRALR